MNKSKLDSDLVELYRRAVVTRLWSWAPGQLVLVPDNEDNPVHGTRIAWFAGGSWLTYRGGYKMGTLLRPDQGIRLDWYVPDLSDGATRGAALERLRKVSERPSLFFMPIVGIDAVSTTVFWDPYDTHGPIREANGDRVPGGLTEAESIVVAFEFFSRELP